MATDTRDKASLGGSLGVMFGVTRDVRYVVVCGSYLLHKGDTNRKAK